MLRARTPANGTLNLPAGASVRDALSIMGIGADEVQAVSVNGRIERNLECTLAAADELTVLPPVSGGCHGRHDETGPFE